MNLATQIKSGETAYNAYCNATGWKSLVSGQQLPEWHNLRVEIQRAWAISATAVLQLGHGRIAEVLKDSEALCAQIESSGCSTALTQCSIQAANLRSKIQAMFND